MLDLVNSSDRPIAIAAFEETRQLINKKIRDAQLRGMLIEELRRTDPKQRRGTLANWFKLGMVGAT